MIANLIYIAIGGGLGSICRFFISELTAKANSTSFPVATFAVNIIGSFLVGILSGIIYLNTNLNYLLIIGFCGGFTTFSTYSKEIFFFLEKKKIMLAIIYTFASTIFGLTSVLLGYMTSK